MNCTRQEIKEIVYNIFSENTMLGVYSPADTLFDMAPLRRDSEETIKKQICEKFGLNISQPMMNMRADYLINMIYLYVVNNRTTTNNFLRAKQLERRIRINQKKENNMKKTNNKLTKSQAMKKVNELISDQSGIPVYDITDSASFCFDLAMDSIDTEALKVSVEKFFKIKLDDKQLPRYAALSVMDIKKYICNNVQFATENFDKQKQIIPNTTNKHNR